MAKMIIAAEKKNEPMSLEAFLATRRWLAVDREWVYIGRWAIRMPVSQDDGYRAMGRLYPSRNSAEIGLYDHLRRTKHGLEWDEQDLLEIAAIAAEQREATRDS